MKLKAFSVYDEKAECFAHPFFVSATGIATRMLATWANNPESTICKYPSDFTLYEVGSWNDGQAKFDTITPPKFIAKASEYKERDVAEFPRATPGEEKTA